MCKISVLVVNLNNLEYTKGCINDLLNQDCDFNLTIVDQNSTEKGTIEYLSNLPSNIEVIKNSENKPLNQLWNWFVERSNTPYICLLNNDVRIAPNFLSSAILVLEIEKNVGFVNHVTNNKSYTCWNNILNYEIIEMPYRQGWDPIFKKECYSKIPEDLLFFYGDDYIYSNLYSSGMRGAYVLNSPMIHFERSTTIEKGGHRDLSTDYYFFNKLDLHKNLNFVERLSKWKPEFNEIKSRVYITHVTKDYLSIAINLSKSLSLFSKLPLIVYCVNLEDSDKKYFDLYPNVQLRNINLDVNSNSTDYIKNESGNFYINRKSPRIYKILSAKTIAMEMALEEGYQEVCYLDSDCLATPNVDELFEWMSEITDFPIATEGIHEYMVVIENGKQRGNPFEFSWPNADNKFSLEWPLMEFLGIEPDRRVRYRTTGIMLMNQDCLPFIKEWKELCFLLPEIVDVTYFAPFHEETVYNVLCCKKKPSGFPLCYINIDGLETVKHFYSYNSIEGELRWSDNEYEKNFYKIPIEKRYVKVLHGEKRTYEIDKILNFFNNKMIKFIQPNDENPFGKIEVRISEKLLNFREPYTFQCINTIDNKIKWQCNNMYLNWWASYVEPCNSISKLIDSENNIIEQWEWSTEEHGDYSHRMFLEWSKNNKGSKGIAIGVHDGTTGEWVVPVRDNLIQGFLVEASDKQFEDLLLNYNNFENVDVLKLLVTKDGKDCYFFESDDGFTNSVNREHVLKYNSNIKDVMKKSISLNDLIIKCGLKNDLDWLHLDVEGIDDELVMSLDPTLVKMPELIIYESLNLTTDRKNKTIKFLESNGYTCTESGWNTIAIKKKIDLSLLIHTCDNYEKFWSGMFYTLDFYWDYNKIPVYFANEEKPISDIIFNCKGYQYRPDKRIKQILTGKSNDMYGFSTRFIEAVKQIPSKYVLYMQEDMWLKRSIDYKTLEDIITFMDENNADSVRLHAKLFYYESYKLEQTKTIISGKRMHKNVGEHILSHNATIWRKDYILKYQIPGEDPWSNEIEGSKRMSVDNNNNYHYNIHWYCQPGIAEKGEFSQEALIYAHIVDEMKKIEIESK